MKFAWPNGTPAVHAKPLQSLPEKGSKQGGQGEGGRGGAAASATWGGSPSTHQARDASRRWHRVPDMGCRRADLRLCGGSKPGRTHPASPLLSPVPVPRGPLTPTLHPPRSLPLEGPQGHPSHSSWRHRDQTHPLPSTMASFRWMYEAGNMPFGGNRKQFLRSIRTVRANQSAAPTGAGGVTGSGLVPQASANPHVRRTENQYERWRLHKPVFQRGRWRLRKGQKQSVCKGSSPRGPSCTCPTGRASFSLPTWTEADQGPPAPALMAHDGL